MNFLSVEFNDVAVVVVVIAVAVVVVVVVVVVVDGVVVVLVVVVVVVAVFVVVVVIIDTDVKVCQGSATSFCRNRCHNRVKSLTTFFSALQVPIRIPRQLEITFESKLLRNTTLNLCSYYFNFCHINAT